MNTLWLGSQNSFSAYHTLHKLYADKDAPKLENNSGEITLDPSFQQPDHRIGLRHIARIGNLALLNIHGSTVNAAKWWHEYAVGDVISYDAIKDAVDILNNTADISTVVVSFSTGGGSALGIDSVTRSLKSLSLNKKVVGHTATGSFSAGYWMMSSLPKIFGEKLAEVGSIGVMLVIPDYSEMLAKEGITVHLFKAGREKAYGFEYTEFTEEEKAAIQAGVDKMNNFFLAHVSEHRPQLSLNDTDSWAEAQCFFAQDATARGLLDGVVNLEVLIGSLTASTSGENSNMIISADKLALLAAGADPTKVLTTLEQAVWRKHLQQQQEQDPEPNPEPTGEGENGDGGAPTPEPEPEPTASQSNHLELAKELGKAEAKIELLTEQLAAQTNKQEAATKDTAALLAVAQVAVANLQTALQMPKEAKGTVAEVLVQYQELQDKMAATFKVGRQSSAGNETEPPQPTQVPNPNRYIP